MVLQKIIFKEGYIKINKSLSNRNYTWIKEKESRCIISVVYEGRGLTIPTCFNGMLVMLDGEVLHLVFQENNAEQMKWTSSKMLIGKQVQL